MDINIKKLAETLDKEEFVYCVNKDGSITVWRYYRQRLISLATYYEPAEYTEEERPYITVKSFGKVALVFDEEETLLEAFDFGEWRECDYPELFYQLMDVHTPLSDIQKEYDELMLEAYMFY